MTLEIARTTEPLPTRTSEQSLWWRKELLKSWLQTNFDTRSAREMKGLFPFFGWPHVADWHPETMIWADAIQPRTKPKQGPKAFIAAWPVI
jgi:hypothetical protein